MHNIETHYIDNSAALEDYCQILDGHEWLAVDTEFLRESTYFPKFCLLQIANTDSVACIDPLAVEDLNPIFEILYNPRITKVFHSGRQDLEIFFNIRGCLPGPVFDTQMAAPLLGYTEQIGYGALISEILGINLVKAHTRTDWSQRPLSKAQLNYATDDVIYLGQVYLKMQEKLSSAGRLDWLVEDFSTLLDPELYRNPPEKAWKRVKGAQSLRGESLSILQNLAKWREQSAHNNNIPRNWVIKDDILLSIARLKPTRSDELKTLRGLHERNIKRHGKEICQIVEKVRSIPPIGVETGPRVTKKPPEHEALVHMLTGIVHQIALKYSLNANTLAPKKELELLVSGDFQNKLLNGWRKAIVGDELVAILNGKRKISVNNRVLQIE